MRGTEFAELSAFVAVAELRNFTKAARQIGIAPPTLSQTIRSLEERLGVRLFNRTTRSVALTEVGEQLLAHMRPLLDGVDKAIEAVNSYRSKPMGSLRLAVSRFAANTVISPLITGFLSEYPDIKMEIAADDTHLDIVREHFDAGIRFSELIEKDMIAVRLTGPVRIIVVASPQYIASHPPLLTPRDLRLHNCIQYRRPWDDVINRWSFEKDGEHVDVAVEGTLTVNEIDLSLKAALDGLGIARAVEDRALPLIRDGQLVPLLKGWCPSLSGFFLYYSSRRQLPPALQAFIDFARKQRNGGAQSPRSVGESTHAPANSPFVEK